MVSYWNLLILLSAAELTMATIFIVLVAGIAKRPVGARLVVIGVVFTVQALVSIIAFAWWKNHGYGPEIARPLLAYHALTLSGLAILLDIVRQ